MDAFPLFPNLLDNEQPFMFELGYCAENNTDENNHPKIWIPTTVSVDVHALPLDIIDEKNWLNLDVIKENESVFSKCFERCAHQSDFLDNWEKYFHKANADIHVLQSTKLIGRTAIDFERALLKNDFFLNLCINKKKTMPSRKYAQSLSLFLTFIGRLLISLSLIIYL